MKIRIKQVSEKLEIPVSTIRHWQREFSLFIDLKKTSGGQRIYSEKDIAFLTMLKELIYKRKKSLSEVRVILESKGVVDGVIDWPNAKILITGGTGSFGKHFCRTILDKYNPEVVRIFSRDELKQHEMRQEFSQYPNLRFFLGDIRDIDRLNRAMENVDIVIHAAALKQVPACEYNPFEAVKTNIIGAQNVIDAAINCKVGRTIALSTDKAVNPVNLYGATKLCSDKIFIQGNSYSGDRSSRFSCVRYGNVIGSRGSVVPLFLKQKKTGVITITDKQMTRFWITLDQAVSMVIKGLGMMNGGEIFIPKIPSMKVIDLAKAVAPKCKVKSIGIRPGEKLHEVLMTEDDSRNAVELEDMYVVKPGHSWWESANFEFFRKVTEGFLYDSKSNTDWLTVAELKHLLANSSDA